MLGTRNYSLMQGRSSALSVNPKRKKKEKRNFLEKKKRNVLVE